MKTRVYAPPFIKANALDEDGFLELRQGAVLRDVYKKLKIPIFFRRIIVCTVNYEKAKMDTVLFENDIISFITPLAGG